MKPKEIQDLIDFIAKSGLQEVNIETDEFKLKVRKNAENKTIIENPVTSAAPVQAAIPQTPVVTNEDQQPTVETVSNNHVVVKSPMIGTFYRSASPEAEPFVKVGDPIDLGDTVCIVEAMKLFNEIESEVSGIIIKVLVDNASPVEYDQELFLVDPS